MNPTPFPTTAPVQAHASSGAQLGTQGRGGTPVRVRYAFTMATKKHGPVDFFNVLEPGHPLGFMSSVSFKTIADAGYRPVFSMETAS